MSVTLTRGAIRQSEGGRLEVTGRLLEEDEQVQVWLDNSPARCRVVKRRSNWLIVLPDGRVTGGIGLRAELLET